MSLKSMFNSLLMSFYSPTRLLNIYSLIAHKDLVRNWSKASVVYWYRAWVCSTRLADAVSTAHCSDSDWSFFPPSELDIIVITTTILQSSNFHGAYLNINIYTGCSCKVHLFFFTWFKLIFLLKNDYYNYCINDSLVTSYRISIQESSVASQRRDLTVSYYGHCPSYTTCLSIKLIYKIWLVAEEICVVKFECEELKITSAAVFNN